MAFPIGIVGMEKKKKKKTTDTVELILALVRFGESTLCRPACLKKEELCAGGINDQQERKLLYFT